MQQQVVAGALLTRLAGVELADAGDGPALVHHGGRSSLCLAEHDVHKVRGRRHHADGLEVVQHHGGGGDLRSAVACAQHI